MEETDRPAPTEVCARVAAQRLPRWEELPDFELYMDQVLSLMERYLGGYPNFEAKGLTASMVNNYVKLGVMPPPVKKKYTRIHLAYLIMICLLKPVLPIDLIRRLSRTPGGKETVPEGYDWFCSEFEQALGCAADGVSGDAGVLKIYRAALRAQAEQAIALRLCGATLPEPPKKEKKEKKAKK